MTDAATDNTLTACEAPDRPLTTFVLFAYNQEAFIREAIAGAFAQTYSPLEIILSDDCSTDGTFAIMEEMAASYRGPHQVKAVQTPGNLGLIQHMLLRGREAQGEIVVVGAGDDVSHPNRVAVMVGAFTPDVGAAYSLCDQIDQSGSVIKAQMERGIRPVSFDAKIARAMSLKGDTKHVRVTQGSTAAYRAMLFDVPVNSDRKPYSEEMLLCFYCHFLGMRVAMVNESLVAYRQHQGAMTNVTDAQRSARAAVPENLARFARRSNIVMFADFHEIASKHDAAGRIDRAALVRNLHEEETKFFWIDMSFRQKLSAMLASALEGNLALSGWCLARILGVYKFIQRRRASSIVN